MRCCVVGMVLLLACSDAVEAPEPASPIARAPAPSISPPARPALPAEPDENVADENDSDDNDSDHHVIIDVEDRCPEDPADRDDYEDGCPELDVQSAAIVIESSEESDISWTERGYVAKYTHGGSTTELYINDRDHDSASDEADPCPDEPEDYDGWEDDDGCPDADTSSHPVIDTGVVF